MNHTTLAAALLSLVAAPVAASPLAPLFNYTGQIRAQANVVEAQARAAFEHCPRGRLLADDIYDELEDVCRELDRLEEHLGRSALTNHGLRRLERLARRLDDAACEVNDAVRESLADARRRNRPILPHATPLRTTSYLPSRHSTFYPGITRDPIRRGGVNVSFVNGRVHVNVGNRPVVTRRVSHRIAPPTLIGTGGIAPPIERALCAESDRLRLMTKQLLAIVCH
ncbi:hypothetical protein MalM25_09950 [Planctomycetes bacterium MalM25]|nr:hypothetical protein MalM25_09950 [Planctomycetes bacterium MalM25]